MRKQSRFNQLPVVLVFAAVTTLGAAACSAAKPAAQTANIELPPRAAVEHSERTTLNRMKLGSLAAARIILEGLALPGVGATAYSTSNNLIVYGNAGQPNNSSKPLTFVTYVPENHQLGLHASSRTTFDENGLSTLTMGVTFTLTGNNPLLKNTGQALTEGALLTSLSVPDDIKLVSAGATYSPTIGFGVAQSSTSVETFEGRGAEISTFVVEKIDTLRTSTDTASQLVTAEASLSSTLQKASRQLGQQFAD